MSPSQIHEIVFQFQVIVFNVHQIKVGFFWGGGGGGAPGLTFASFIEAELQLFY